MGHFIEMAKKAINADTAGEYLAITAQMRFYDVRYWELKEIFHIWFIQEALCPDKMTSKVINEVAYERIFDKLRSMWRAKMLAKVQKEIQLEINISLRQKLKAKGIDLNATEKGKIVTETLFDMCKQVEIYA